jgi:hypothetical protein
MLHIVRSEVLTAVTVKITIFSVVTPPILTDVYRRFGGTFDLNLQATGYGLDDRRVGIF